MKSGLSSFAADARDNGGQLHQAHDRLAELELLSNEMLDRLASSGVRIDDTPFIDFAQAAMREIAGVDRGRRSRAARSSEDDVFDTDYVPMPGTNPTQYETALLRLRRRAMSGRSSTG